MAVDLIAQTVYGFAIHGSPPQEMFSPDLAGSFAEKFDPAGWPAQSRSALGHLSGALCPRFPVCHLQVCARLIISIRKIYKKRFHNTRISAILSRVERRVRFLLSVFFCVFM